VSHLTPNDEEDLVTIAANGGGDSKRHRTTPIGDFAVLPLTAASRHSLTTARDPSLPVAL